MKRIRELISQRRRALTIFGALFIVLCVVWLIGPFNLYFDLTFGPNFDPKFDRNQALSQARTRWAAQNISTYRMTISYQSKQYGQDSGTCQEEVTVEKNSIMANNPNQQPCGSYEPVRTIPDLFQIIDHDINNLRWDQCEVLMVNVTYDPKFGYPQYIKYTWEEASPKNVGRDFNTQRMQCVGLDMFNPDVDDIRVISLTPLTP